MGAPFWGNLADFHLAFYENRARGVLVWLVLYVKLEHQISTKKDTFFVPEFITLKSIISMISCVQNIIGSSFMSRRTSAEPL